MKFDEIGFRGIDHNAFGFSIDGLNKEIFKDFEGYAKANYALGYGYIDHDAGVTFEILCLGICNDDLVNFYRGNDEISIKVRIGSVKDEDLEYFSSKDKNVATMLNEFKDKIDAINKNYSVSDVVEDIRHLEELDHLRSDEYPDDVKVIMIKDDLAPEVVWARFESFNNGMFECKLLNEPYQDFGCKEMDLIKVFSADTGNEEETLASFGEKV